MPPLEKSGKRRRTSRYRRRIRTFWITVIAIGLIVIVGAIVLASMDQSSGPSDQDNSSPPASTRP
jgi:uncharacterized membrane protein